MSPTSGPPRKRSAGASFAPIVVAVCAIVIVREALAVVGPGLSPWVVFVLALVVGWLAYTGVERYYVRREGPREPRAQQRPPARRPKDDQ